MIMKLFVENYVTEVICFCQYMVYAICVADNLYLEGKGMDDEYEELKKHFLDAIVCLLEKCNDLELLDLILRILQ